MNIDLEHASVDDIFKELQKRFRTTIFLAEEFDSPDGTANDFHFLRHGPILSQLGMLRRMQLHVEENQRLYSRDKD